MAGMLSRVFEGGDAGQPASQPQTDYVGDDLNDGGAGGAGTATEYSEHSNQQDVAADLGLDVVIGLHAEGSYVDEDGNETHWSRDLEIGLSTDNHLGLGSLTEFGEDSMSG